MKLEECKNKCKLRDYRIENPLYYKFYYSYCLDYNIQPEIIMSENLFYMYVKHIYTYSLLLLQITENNNDNASSNLQYTASPLGYEYYRHYCVTNNVEPIPEYYWKDFSDKIYVWILKRNIIIPTIYDFYLNYSNKTNIIISRDTYDTYMVRIYDWSSKTPLILYTKVCPLTYEYYRTYCFKNKIPAVSANDFLNFIQPIAHWMFTCQCDECQPYILQNSLKYRRWEKYATTLYIPNK